MEILYFVPEELKFKIISKCPLGHRIFLEKLLYDSDYELDEKLRECLESYTSTKCSWKYKVRELVNMYKYLLPRRAFNFRMDELELERMSNRIGKRRLENKRRRLKKRKDQVLDEMNSVINFLSFFLKT